MYHHSLTGYPFTYYLLSNDYMRVTVPGTERNRAQPRVYGAYLPRGKDR